MQLKSISISILVLAVQLLAVETPTRETGDKPPVPVGGWAAFQDRVVYPEMAQDAGTEGEVLIYVFIDELGQATDMKVVEGSVEKGFVAAARAAIRQTAFEPGQRHSIPVGMWLSIRVVFSIYG